MVSFLTKLYLPKLRDLGYHLIHTNTILLGNGKMIAQVEKASFFGTQE